MRTTLAIGDEGFVHTRRLALERRTSIGAAVPELLREKGFARTRLRSPRPANAIRAALLLHFESHFTMQP